MQPDYVSYEPKQREEFLSQIGNFSPNERDVFHRLCKNWQPRISYEKFSRLLGSSSGGGAGDLASLMTKLQRGGWGILRSKIAEGNRSRDAIILTDQRSPRFYCELADEYFTDMLESIVNPLPLISIIEKAQGTIPPASILLVEADQLAAVISGKGPHTEKTGILEEQPLAVQSFDNDRLLITRKNLRSFGNMAILKLRYYLTNTTLLGLMAKLQDTSLILLKKSCSGKDGAFWLALTKTIMAHKNDIDSLRNVGIEKTFYHAAWLLKNLIESQIAEAEERKRRQEEENLDLEAIAHAVKETPEKLLPQASLTAMLESQREKYDSEIGRFKEKFFERYVTPEPSRKLPAVLQLDDNFIHRDNLYPLFLEHFRIAEMELPAYFVHLMEHSLRTGNRNQDPTFFTLESFEQALQEQIRSYSTFLPELIGKPVLLAEGIIHHTKLTRQTITPAELRQQLSLYFDTETLRPLPLREWFGLRLVDIFDRAFARLPVWHRLWLRMSGKYESFRGRFLKQTEHTKPLRSFRDTPHHQERSRHDRDQEHLSGKGSTPGRGESSSRSTSPQGRTRGQKGSAATKSQRAYNRKQVESAWKEFGSTLKKND
ncbi:hypothetical protein SAMN05920897_10265 [Alkalispirochaeta americana]|uniref:Uncharacterized protein n=1 Tax=Alkalispirochaeta americana TaxID=159291 RepID=A0A1N6P0D1_9SPIO|nr:hypothetical protein [Alkalispirochaeta americana]SIP97779.1 hypothetical protein SAMN05920897_10265 [Alkalispirochaeta americana]